MHIFENINECIYGKHTEWSIENLFPGDEIKE